MSLKFSSANLIASMSLSKAKRAPSFVIESNIFLECPPLPKVASIYLPEGLVIKKSMILPAILENEASSSLLAFS